MPEIWNIWVVLRYHYYVVPDPKYQAELRIVLKEFSQIANTCPLPESFNLMPLTYWYTFCLYKRHESEKLNRAFELLERLKTKFKQIDKKFISLCESFYEEAPIKPTLPKVHARFLLDSKGG